MNMFNRMQAVLAAAVLALATVVKATEVPLELDVYQADGNSFYVSSVIVSGESEAALIDAQFTRADAHQVVAKILQTGKKLTTVYVSHGDPDYYFGLEVVRQAFPEVKIYASEDTLKYINRSVEKKLAYWGPKLGLNAPTSIVVPELLEGDSFTVDGHELKVIGLKKHPERTYVWIPSAKAVVGGVPVYSNVHLWIADAPTKVKRLQWLGILDEISMLKPEVVVPGHAMSNAPQTLAAVEFSRDYLKAYERALVKADNSTALIDAINKKYPEAGLPVALEIGAKVAMGEMKW